MMIQKGFTLVELLVALAIGSVLMTAAVLSIHQVALGTMRSNDQVAALTDMDQAVLNIKRDLMMAQETNLTAGNPQSSVILSWVDYTGFASANYTAHSANYSLSGTNLLRTYDGMTTIVGRQITSIIFTQDDRVISVSVNATGSRAQRSENIEFTGYIRSVPIE